MNNLIRPGRAGGMLSRFRRDRRGVIAILTALLLPIFAGALALVIDIGYWRYRQMVIQQAADATAVAIQYNLNSGVNALKTARAMSTAATQEAVKNGWKSSGGTVVVNSPPKSGSNVGNSKFVEILLTEQAPRLFSAIWQKGSMTLSARAVATAGGSGGTTVLKGSGCLLALGGQSPLNSQSGIYLQNSGAIIRPGCEAISNSTGNSSAYVDANAQIQSATTLSGMPQLQNNGKITGALKTMQPATEDPYKGKFTLTGAMLTANYNTRGPWACAGVWSDPYNVQRPEIYGTNANNNTLPTWTNQAKMNGGQFYWDAPNNTWRFTQTTNTANGTTYSNYSTTTGNRVNFCRGLILQNTTVTFDPGTYVIAQDINFQNVTVRLNGATLVIANNLYNWNVSNSTFIMTSPSNAVPADLSQGVPGIVLSQMTDDTSSGQAPIEVSNNTEIRWRGAIYLPTKTIRNQTNGRMTAINDKNLTSGGGVCSHIIVRHITILNNVQLANECDIAYGVQPFGTIDGQGWYSTTSGSGTPVGSKLVE